MDLKINKIQDNLGKWVKTSTDNIGKLVKLEKFNVGQSNPTYILKYEKKNLVLRTTPNGKLLRGAHRIDREFKVMSALKNTTIPVPIMYAYCENTKIIGTEFFLMEYIDGYREVSPLLQDYGEEIIESLYLEKLKLLTSLAKLDLKDINLDKYGRLENYLERQIKLWTLQYRASETKKINSMEFLIKNLNENIPNIFDKMPYVLLHGDFRIDNIIFNKANKIACLLDWELSTLAPPFIDLAYWCLMLRFNQKWVIGGLGSCEDRKNLKGIPSEKRLLDSYSKSVGYISEKEWKYLLAFNAFRFTGILQGIKKRVKDGNNAGHNAVHVGDLAESVSNLGKKLFEEAI